MRIKFNSPVILSFSLLSALIYFVSEATGGTLMQNFMLGRVDLSDPSSLFTLVSHALGHVSIEHLLGNLTFILLIGPIVEEKYGSKKTLIMIILTALITGILNIVIFNTGLIGASGIVFMLILLVSFTNSRNGEIPITFILVALLFIGKEVLAALSADQVSQFAHIIGGVCGSIFGFTGRKKPGQMIQPDSIS
jgi:membrane associated rhomboid family serine protease